MHAQGSRDRQTQSGAANQATEAWVAPASYLAPEGQATAMEAVRDLSWSGSAFLERERKAHTGFEPVPPP
jgi:hypothetical protein